MEVRSAVKRGMTGTISTTTVAGERVGAFVPFGLPPQPPLVIDGRLQTLLESATLAVGRLDGASTLLPDKALFLYAFVRKEALVSSQIEGTQSSLSDLLLFEADEMPGVPLDDVQEVSRYVAALDHGVSRLREGFPLSSRLMREVHGVLLAERTRPGSRPRLVPALAELDRRNPTRATRTSCRLPTRRSRMPWPTSSAFLNARDERYPVVGARRARARAVRDDPPLPRRQRSCRTPPHHLLLCDAGVLREPLLYLSLYLKRHRDRYYALLDLVRRGRLGGVARVLRQRRRGGRPGRRRHGRPAVRALRARSLAHRGATGRRAGSALRVHEALKARPLRSITDLAATTGLSFPAASAAVDALVELGVAREFTGRRRDRLFAYDRYVAILGEGTEADLFLKTVIPSRKATRDYLGGRRED
jgi:Fic family protein